MSYHTFGEHQKRKSYGDALLAKNLKFESGISTVECEFPLSELFPVRKCLSKVKSSNSVSTILIVWNSNSNSPMTSGELRARFCQFLVFFSFCSTPDCFLLDQRRNCTQRVAFPSSKTFRENPKSPSQLPFAGAHGRDFKERRPRFETVHALRIRVSRQQKCHLSTTKVPL